MKHMTLKILSAVLLGWLSVGSQAFGQLTKLNVLTTGVSPTSLPSYIARDSGIFARNGLDVQVVRGTSSIATMALISGELGIIEIAGRRFARRPLREPAVLFVPAG